MDEMLGSDSETPESGHRRLILPQPMTLLGTGQPDTETELLAQLGPDTVFMMGDNPALSPMPEKPKLLDFFRRRFTPFARAHLLQSAMVALKSGMEEKVVLACLLHDIANGALIRVDHGYWGAQLIEPHVSEEVSWAVRNHQALRFFADESVGYKYPDAYIKFFGPDYEPEAYVKQAYETARQHRWYMTSRRITLNDLYCSNRTSPWTRSGSPISSAGISSSQRRVLASMARRLRTMIWPNNLL